MSLGAEQVLSQRELNRALLARQLLLERRRLPLPRALERIGGIQAQYAPSMYIGLWSRLDGFERDRLTRALERRSVLQATLMRVTIHLVSAPDFWPFAVGLREPRRDAWFRARRDDPSRREVAAAAERVRGLLADGPRPRAELIEGMDARLFNGVGIWLDLVRVPPGGTWEHRRADVYATGESWIGPPGGTPEEGLELLIRRYLQGFGPAAPAEVADWIGVPTLPVAATLDRLELRRFRTEDGGLLVDLPRAPLPPADTAAPARFIPTWDSTSSSTAAGRPSSLRSTARRSSTRGRPSRSRPSRSMARWRAPGATRTGGSRLSRSDGCPPARGPSWRTRRSAWPRSWRE
jgi:Winged helix DNA-binding domain